MPENHCRIVPRRFQPIVLCILGVVLAAGSAATQQADLPAFGEEIYVIGEIPFLQPVDPGQPVSIRFGIGELEIETTGTSQIRADLEVTCREELAESLCGKYRERLRLEPRVRGEEVEVRLVGLSKWKMRKLRLQGRVELPRWSPLSVRVGVGDVDIHSVAEHLTVTMGIGDLTVRVPAQTVGAVAIGTRIGDATLRRSDGTIVTDRRMLVGARVRWEEGAGDGSVSVGLRIGDAKVVLE